VRGATEFALNVEALPPQWRVVVERKA
jgi:hypothetical protein